LRLRTLCAFAISVPVVVACSADGGSTTASEFVSVDSAGVRIADNGSLSDAKPWRPAGPSLEIGTVAGDPNDQLYRVSSAKRLPDGRILVANAGSREIRLYSVSGDHLLSFGGSGDGPADFRYPSDVAVAPDGSIRVQDRGDLVYFTMGGELTRRETLDRGALGETIEGPFEGGSWVDGETYVVPEYDWEAGASPRTPGPPYRPAMTFISVHMPTQATDTLGEFGGILQQFRDVGGGRAMPVVPPFSHSSTFYSGGGKFVVGDNAESEFHVYSPDGSHLIVRWHDEPESITDQEVAAWKDEQRAASWTDGQLPELERGWAGMALPPYKAFYASVMPTSDGAYWLNETAKDGNARLVRFTPEGRYDREVILPDFYRVMDGGADWVLIVARDDLEVEYLRLYEWPPR